MGIPPSPGGYLESFRMKWGLEQHQWQTDIKTMNPINGRYWGDIETLKSTVFFGNHRWNLKTEAHFLLGKEFILFNLIRGLAPLVLSFKGFFEIGPGVNWPEDIHGCVTTIMFWALPMCQELDSVFKCSIFNSESYSTSLRHGATAQVHTLLSGALRTRRAYTTFSEFPKTAHCIKATKATRNDIASLWDLETKQNS